MAYMFYKQAALFKAEYIFSRSERMRRRVCLIYSSSFSMSSPAKAPRLFKDQGICFSFIAFKNGMLPVIP